MRLLSENDGIEPNVKRMNQNEQQILRELKQDYGDSFADEELEELSR